MSRLGFIRRVVVARKEHECYDCGRRISPGRSYAVVTAMPRYDFNPHPGHWTRAAFCMPDPVTEETP